MTQAINKFWRKQLKCGEVQLENAGFRNEEYYNLVEELADVSVMLEQMIYFMDCEDRVYTTMNEKLDRQMRRIEEEIFATVNGYVQNGFFRCQQNRRVKT